MRIDHPLVILTWPEPNYINPPSRASAVVVCASVCIAIITLVMSARLYTRAFIVRWFGVDDWLAIPAAITALGYCIIALLGKKYGWYIHLWDLQLPRIEGAQKLVIAASLIGLWNVGFTKLSILCLYRRLTPESWFRITVNVVLAITIMWMVAMTITNFLLCIPLQAYWHYDWRKPQKCFNQTRYYAAFAAIDIALDITVWTLPLFFIVPMRLPVRQKAILLATFAVGLLTIAAAANRLPSLIRTSNSEDWTWEIYDPAIWTMIEATVGITCASVPTFKPLVARYAPSILGSIRSHVSRSEEGSTGPHRYAQDQSDGSKCFAIDSTTTACSSSDEDRRYTITKTTDIEMQHGRHASEMDDKYEADFF